MRFYKYILLLSFLFSINSSTWASMPANKKKQEVDVVIEYYEQNTVQNSQDLNKLTVAYQVAEGIAYIDGQAKILLNIFNYYFRTNNYRDCRPYIEKCDALLSFISDDELKANCLYKMSDYYLINAEFSRSIDYAYRAKAIYNRLNLPMEYLVYDLLAQYSLVYQDFQQAVDYYKIALDYYQSVSDTLQIANISNNMAYPYQQLHEYDSAEYYYKNAVSINKKLKRYRSLGRNYLNLGLYYYDLDNYERSDYYNELAIQLGDSLQDEEIIVKPYLTMGKNALAYGDYRKALSLLFMSANRITEPSLYDLNGDIYSELCNTYEKLNMYDSALYFYKRSVVINDSILRMESNELLNQQEAKYELKIELRDKQMRNRIQLFSIIIVILSSIILIFLLYKLYKTQKARVKSIKGEKKVLESELEKKDRELASHMINLIHANEKKILVTKKLMASKEKLSKENQKMIDKIIDELDDDQLKNVWQEFEMRFSQVHSQFYDVLFQHHPNLTKNEKRLCALLYLDLTTKEISSITFQSQRALEVARVRLRKKLEITNTTQSISQYLQNLI